ncbi:hypothetical protein [Bacillus timonensis]|nr:hypothetical protein [Bacillus timonensis]
MNERTKQFSYDEIDRLLDSIDKDMFKDIKWKTITEEEMESLLRTP